AKATLRELTRNDDEAFRRMHIIGARIMEGLGELMERYDHEGIVQGLGPMFQVFFTKERKITGYRQTLNANTERFRTFRNLMLQRRVYFHHADMESIMISAADDKIYD